MINILHLTRFALFFGLACSGLWASPTGQSTGESTAQSVPLDPPATAQLLARMAETRAALGPRQMNYTETRTNPLLVHPVLQQGTIFITPDNFFRKESKSSTLISDGKTLWIAYKDFAEVEQYPLEGRSPLARELRPLLSGFSPEKLRSTFHVSARESADGFFLHLRPRRGGQNLVREIRSEWTRDLEIASLEIIGADGSQTRLRFSHHAPLQVTPHTFAPPTEE